MEFKFVKSKDGNDVVFVSNMNISNECTDDNMDSLCAMFKSFLLACGYNIAFHDDIGIIPRNNDITSGDMFDNFIDVLKKTDKDNPAQKPSSASPCDGIVAMAGCDKGSEVVSNYFEVPEDDKTIKVETLESKIKSIDIVGKTTDEVFNEFVSKPIPCIKKNKSNGNPMDNVSHPVHGMPEKEYNKHITLDEIVYDDKEYLD